MGALTQQIPSPSCRAYEPPEGFEDFPFFWCFDGSALTDGGQSLNNRVYIEGGWGDFIMRRIAGLASVVNPAGGSFLIRDAQNRPLSSDPILINGGTDDFAFPNEVLYPETSKISFDLYNVLRDPPAVLAGEIVNDVTGWRFPNGRGQALAGPFYNGSNIYVVFGNGGAGLGPAIRTFKSSDGGVTWAEMNAAGAPTSASILKNQGVCQSGTKLFITWLKLVGPTYRLQMVVFDTATNTYGANVQGPDTGLGAAPSFNAGTYADSNYQAVPADRGDGNIAVAYTSQGALLQTSYVTWSIAGGAWGASQIIATSATVDYVPEGLYVDPARRSYVTILEVDAGGVITLRSVVLNSLGVLVSGPSLLSAACFQPGALNYACICVSGGFVDVANGQIVVLRTNGTAHIGISVAPFADVPVWTDHDSTAVAFTTNFTQANNAPQLAQALPFGGKVTVLYYDNGSGVGNADANLNQITFDPVAGAWGAPVAVITDVVNNLAGAIQLSSLSASYNPASGLIGFALSEFGGFTGPGDVGAVFGKLIAKVLQTQIAFQGVRRLPRLGAAIDDSCDYSERTFTYSLQGVMTATGPATSPSLSLIQTIDDYDFDLYQIILTYSAASALPRVVASVMLFDYAKNQISNIPVLDVYLNGAPGSPYKNGAIMPPLRYQQSTQIRLDLYSLSPVAPVTVTAHLVGRQRYPKHRMAA